MSTEKPVIVIHHSADFDGLFCREIARYHFGEGAQYIGWDYGQPVPSVPLYARLYMLDISIKELMPHPNLVWIDHHKSAIEAYGAGIPGYRLDGVAACRLAWQWFEALFFVEEGEASRLAARAMADLPSEGGWGLPGKRQFVDRSITEPLAVRLAGEYDIWDKRDPRVDLFQSGLKSQDIDWPRLLADHEDDEPGGPERYVEELLIAGKYIAYSQAKESEWLIREMGFTLKFEGLTFLAVNAAGGNSALFTSGLRDEHDACMAFRWDGKKWRISLRGAPRRSDLDLSPIAVKHGGGGHRQACGFECAVLPFELAAGPEERS